MYYLGHCLNVRLCKSTFIQFDERQFHLRAHERDFFGSCSLTATMTYLTINYQRFRKCTEYFLKSIKSIRKLIEASHLQYLSSYALYALFLQVAWRYCCLHCVEGRSTSAFVLTRLAKRSRLSEHNQQGNNTGSDDSEDLRYYYQRAQSYSCK